jgi:hypothetical protein
MTNQRRGINSNVSPAEKKNTLWHLQCTQPAENETYSSKKTQYWAQDDGVVPQGKKNTTELSNLYEAGHPLPARIRSKWRRALPKDWLLQKRQETNPAIWDRLW